MAKFVLYFVFTIVGFGPHFNAENVDKRILLNDPDLVHTQIQAIQRELETIKTQLAAQVNINSAYQAEVDSLKRSTNQHSSQGSTYTIWGRKNCPSNTGTKAIYSGIAGGGHYNQPGNGANTLCLPHNPDPAPSDFPTHFQNDDRASSGFLYGSEYQYTYRNVAVDDDVPCAVCDVARASSVIMIPAKINCPTEWSIEYSGVLTSSVQHPSVHHIGEYLCVDMNAEYLSEGTRQQDYNGRLFYPVQAVCGSLPCPPYRSAQLISCVVCSK